MFHYISAVLTLSKVVGCIRVSARIRVISIIDRPVPERGGVALNKCRYLNYRRSKPGLQTPGILAHHSPTITTNGPPGSPGVFEYPAGDTFLRCVPANNMYDMTTTMIWIYRWVVWA